MKKILLIIFALIILAIIIFGLKLLSGEDTWICQKGSWVKHGNPQTPAPTTLCK